MAKGKRHVQRLPARSRTRQHKPKLADPDSSVELSAQLNTLGLRLHNTLGDGNCLFRALSDQLYGTEVYHLTLRADITAWMAKYAERYEGFVEDDRSFEDHLRCMREPGTYGGHLELSAFAHLKRKNVKVIQPGLVYVIEWDAGSPFSDPLRDEDKDMVPLSPDGDRDKRRSRREKRRTSADAHMSTEPTVSSHILGDTVYVAYHDWEHFSSLRTLTGERPLIVYPPTSHTAGVDAHKDISYDSQSASTSVPAPRFAPIASDPVPAASQAVSSPTIIKVKRPRGRPRKYPSSSPTQSPAIPPTLSVPASSSAASSSLAPTSAPLLLDRSLSPSATSSASTAASLPGSTSSSTTTNSASGSTASSSIPPVTPSDSQSLLDPNLPPQPPAPIEPRSGPTLLSQSHSASSARTRRYDPSLFNRSSPKRHFVEGEGDADFNGFASEDSETRSAKRRVVGLDGRVSHQPPNGSSHLNPSFAVDHEANISCPISRASSTTASLTNSGMGDVSVSEVEASLTQFGDADADDGEELTDGDEGATIGDPPSPAATTTRRSSKSRTAPGAGKGDKEKGGAPLTRRERKRLGLPKSHPRRVILKVNGQRPGVRAAVEESMQPPGLPPEQAWTKNGNGRMDVRGFRELKI